MKTVDNNYNIFVLSLVLIRKKDYKKIDMGFKKIKKDIFGDENFIIHTWELTHPTHRKSDKRNGIMRVHEKREEFYKKMNDFIESSLIKTCFTVVRKLHFAGKYVFPSDPYELSFENHLNRILHYSSGDDISIYAESRDDALDKSLLAEYTKYSIKGVCFHDSEKMKRIKEFNIKSKKENITGLQIADLLASPVARHFLNIKPRPIGNEIPYSLVRKKLAGNIKLSITIIPDDAEINLLK